MSSAAWPMYDWVLNETDVRIHRWILCILVCIAPSRTHIRRTYVWVWSSKHVPQMPWRYCFPLVEGMRRRRRIAWHLGGARTKQLSTIWWMLSRRTRRCVVWLRGLVHGLTCVAQRLSVRWRVCQPERSSVWGSEKYKYHNHRVAWLCNVLVTFSKGSAQSHAAHHNHRKL